MEGRKEEKEGERRRKGWRKDSRVETYRKKYNYFKSAKSFHLLNLL
jgi:hypothetical protein